MSNRCLPWVIWFLGAVFVLYQFLLQSANSVMITGLRADLHINLTQIGFLSASFFYSYVVLQIPAGLLVDRFGARRMMLLGLFLCALATASFSLIEFFWQGILLRVLMGIGSSSAVVGVMYLACRWFPKHLFPLLAAMVEMMGMLGGAIGETSLAHLVGHFGWRGAMLCAGIAGAVLWLVMLMFVQNAPRGESQENCSAAALPLKALLGRFKAAMQQREIWLAGAFCGLCFSLIVSFGGLWSIHFLQDAYQYSLTRAAYLSSFIFLGAALGAFIFGHLACMVKKIRFLMVLASSLAACALAMIIYVSLPFNILLVLFFVGGFGSGGYVLSFAYIKKNTCETISASSMGFTNMMCILIGAPIVQPLIGALISYYQHHASSMTLVYERSLSLLIALQILGIIAVLLMRKSAPSNH